LVWKLVLVNTTSSGTASFGLETGAGEHHQFWNCIIWFGNWYW
jgi:hypothetical protein